MIQLITGLEFCLVPVVEVIMHVQTALKPLFSPAMPLERRITALTGTLAAVAFHCAMWRLGGAAALGGYGLATALWLHGLAVHDCFQHTFETLNSEDPNYKSGPGPRTAAYEQENTYSDLISVSAPWLNLLFLNFGYHNAHHAKANVPWYQLPAAHAALFGSDTKQARGVMCVCGGGSEGGDAPIHSLGPTRCPSQVFPMAELMGSWWRFRTRRVLDESYGFVERRGELFTDRAKAFVGSLGVSFLTV